MSLTVSVRNSRNVLIIGLVGELDHHTATRVRETIDRELVGGGAEHLVINLAQLDFMDSSGLGVLLGRFKKVAQNGGKMSLCRIKPSVYRLMEMSGLFKVMPIYEDEHSAIQACEVAS
ncbi:anti-sigma F factor antagonist [Hazenella sp. IB182357]|uniref:Anti-sigma F factor antagonist n=1 Tax=Polycladospora coralii TaxID=2771432 RepID=A0A926NAK0_9BACL|nr:anti-sigma F factor antagonist [Polycladospora coralii]MBD1372967.1 anti-sigma F factor antagonist [Polycladospora coralii]MBS7530976.1 anti-sigma F factor antagonist [Polycladospora coralii]